MNSKDVLKKIITEQGVSQAELARQINITPATLWDRMNSKKTNSLTINKLSEILDVLGYEILISPKKENKNNDNVYVINE
jgi:transcriptional regulator with XRE-family HTH domain